MINRHKSAGIEYTIAEPSSADTDTETIVFMHGIGGDDTSFEAQSAALSDQFRIIAWNMPGYRQSDRLPSVSFAGLAQALTQLLDELGLQSCHIAGQSIGGMVAQEFYFTYPQRVKSLILIATTSAFGGRDDSFRDAFLAARLKPLDDGVSMAQLAEQAMPAITGREISAVAMQAAISAMAAIEAQVYRDVLRCLVTFDRRADFPTIECPTCLIAGEIDTNAPAATMKKMAARLKQAEYNEIAGAGHLVNSEAPDSCNQIIRGFIRAYGR